ncbi:MAG: hypothetical protein Q9216_001823 [Gyalolechia sp. 2 TL-2023]
MTLAEPRGGVASLLRSPRFLFVVFAISGAFVFFFARPQNAIQSLVQPDSPNASTASLSKGTPPLGSSADVKNSTLGFEKIFVINLPERHDKLDAFSLAASLTGFTHGVIEGVRGQDVVNKSLPSLEMANPPKSEKGRSNIIGCWRAHLNFAQRIVRERISTALVVEDDSDWDVSFREQMADFATGSRYISGTAKKPRSPYGDDWDLLWLGHCAVQEDPSDQRRFVIENDDTVPPQQHRVNFSKCPKLNEEGYDNSTRIVFRAKDGVCLYAYALSFHGAQKVLRWQNKMDKFLPIDISIGNQCKNDPNFKCIGVFPQLIDSHKPAGRQSRDSDIGTFDPNNIREKGFTNNIVRSTRLNIETLLYDGEKAKIEDQWPDMPQLTGPRRTRFHNFPIQPTLSTFIHGMLSQIFALSALALLGAAPVPVSSTRLYVSSYAGTITTFDLSKVGNASYQLAPLDTSTGCSPNASWLQIDVKHRNLFCLDEGFAVGNGTLTSFKIKDDKNGSLSTVNHTVIPNAPVNSAIFNGPNGSQLLAVAHYAWALTTWKVNPATASYSPLQSFNFTQPKPGPKADRQAAPHPHQVLVDPTNKYLVIPDLGSDLIRIFYIDPQTLQVSPRPSINVTAGSGPRHGVFYSPGRRAGINRGAIDFYLVSELSSTLAGYKVFYHPNNGGMGLTPFADPVHTWGPSNDTIFSGNAPAEIILAPGAIANQGVQLLVSNRNATFFKDIKNPDPKNATHIDSDTIASFTIPKSGRKFAPKFGGLVPAGGSFPRHFSINREGSLLAVGLQNSGRLVVLERCAKTGVIGEVVADFEGLGQVSNIVWDEPPRKGD